MRVLVTGAGGYVGSRLVPALLDRGHEIVAGFTDPRRATSFPWAGSVRAVRCDVLDPGSVDAAVGGTGGGTVDGTRDDGPVDAVVYLVHRMADGPAFREEDALGAAHTRDAMDAAGVGRCVYLSGLRPDCEPDELSEHMASRGEVEGILASGVTPSLAVRAGVVLGAGSTSFEVLRTLCELLPVQPVPSWMRHRVEPVAEVDVVEALCGALEGPARRGHADIGCGQTLTYPDLLRLYGRVDRRPTLRIPVPPVPWELVAHGLARVVPQDPVTVAAMIESLRHDMVCGDRSAADELVPDGWEWTSAEDAIRSALASGRMGP